MRSFVSSGIRYMIKYLFAILISTVLSQTVSAQSGHAIHVQLQHFRKGKLYLGNYYGNNTFLIDSASISSSGKALFKGKDTLPGGIYFILFPHKHRYFELLIDRQQHFGITADTSDHFTHLTFQHSEDNVLFRQYNQYLDRQQQRVIQAKAAGKDSIAVAAVKDSVQKNIHHYRKQFIHDHPQKLLAVIFKAMQDPVIPPAPPHTTDSAFAYHYFKAHYWDGIDFSDNRIVRTPVLETRLQRYFTRLVPPVPDSVNQAADQLLSRAKADKEVFKYVLWWLTSTYEKSPYMGMDAVFVHLVEQYYVTGEAYWVKEDQLKKIIDKASRIAPNLIGNTAPDLKLKTREGQSILLSAVRSPYIVLAFWDPTCGHCKITIPKLDSAYESRWKKMGVKMIGVLSGGTKEQWSDFIKEQHLEDWINLWDPQGESNYRQLYDVYMTPVIYLLDKNKKILAKQLNVKQLNAFLNRITDKKAAS